MRFEYYHDGLADVPKLSVDGTVANAVHFSHWRGNQTDASVKADTSTEITLNLVASPHPDELTRGIELVTNNHFDTDGVLSVWTVLNGSRALELRDRLIPAAAAGDFCEFTGADAVRANIVIQGSESPIDEDSGSPLARQLAGAPVTDDAMAYDLVLPMVERVLTNVNEYESLWRPAWERIAVAMESFASGSSIVRESPETNLSVITLSPEVFGADGFQPAIQAAPFTAISHHARGELFLIGTPLRSGWSYRIDYPYYSWAETIVRPPIARRDFTSVVARLNELERGRSGTSGTSGTWKLDSSELASAVKFQGPNGRLAPSDLHADEVTREIRAALIPAQRPTTEACHA
jgi:hypothetical protein